jgi:hypothetical protein
MAAGCATLLAVISIARSAGVIHDSFDAGGTFDPQNNLGAALANIMLPATNALRAAAQFTVGCDDFHLASVTLPISVSKYGTTADLLRVRITGDAGGMPGATLEVLSQNQTNWPAISNPFTNKTTLFSLTTPLLSQGSNYWIVTEPTAFPTGGQAIVDYRRFYSTNRPLVTARQQESLGALPTDPWPGGATALPLAFRVEGTPVTLPSLSIQLSQQVELCWESCTNMLYQVQYATNLDPVVWQDWGSPVQGNSSQTCITNPIVEGQPARYYRLLIP